MALILADQRMPHLTGTEVLARAGERFPDAKRILLSTYAHTDAAIEAINQASVDSYLLEPWHPPEEKLFPVLDEFLDDWQAHYEPAFDGVRLIAYRWTAEAHTLKGFLARNQVPYQFLDHENGRRPRRLLEDAGLGDAHIPAVVFQDGSSLAHAAPPRASARSLSNGRLREARPTRVPG